MLRLFGFVLKARFTADESFIALSGSGADNAFADALSNGASVVGGNVVDLVANLFGAASNSTASTNMGDKGSGDAAFGDEGNHRACHQ